MAHLECVQKLTEMTGDDDLALRPTELEAVRFAIEFIKFTGHEHSQPREEGKAK